MFVMPVVGWQWPKRICASRPR